MEGCYLIENFINYKCWNRSNIWDKRAKELGYFVVAADGNPKAPGFSYSMINYLFYL